MLIEKKVGEILTVLVETVDKVQKELEEEKERYKRYERTPKRTTLFGRPVYPDVLDCFRESDRLQELNIRLSKLKNLLTTIERLGLYDTVRLTDKEYRMIHGV